MKDEKGNVGIVNTGYFNTGDRNSGDWNSGNRNSGDWNSGNRNSGYFCKGNNLSGIFCTEQPLYIFNKPCDLQLTDSFRDQLYALNFKPLTEWIYSDDMTDEEKKNNKNWERNKGYLKVHAKLDFSTLTKEDKEFIKSLPNYDDDIFFEITGIRLLQQKKEDDEILIINGKKYKLIN